MIKSITFRLKSSNHVGTIDMRGDVIPCHEVQAAIASKLSAPAEEVRVFMAGSTAPIHPQEDLPAYAVVDVVRQVASTHPSSSSFSFHAYPSGSHASSYGGGTAGHPPPSSSSSAAAASLAYTGARMGRGGGRARGRGGAGMASSSSNALSYTSTGVLSHRGAHRGSCPAAPAHSSHHHPPLAPYAVRGAAAHWGTSQDSTARPPWHNPPRGAPAPAIPMSASAAPSATEEERLAQLQAEVGWETGIDDVAASRRGRRGGWARGGGCAAGHSAAAPYASAPGGGGIQRWGGGYRGGGPEDSFRPPPKGYVCHNCGKGGHLIQHCPSARGGRGGVKVISLPVGIPESMLVECTMDDPAPKFITRNHRLVKRRVDAGAFAQVAAAEQEDGGVRRNEPPRREAESRAHTTTTTPGHVTPAGVQDGLLTESRPETMHASATRCTDTTTIPGAAEEDSSTSTSRRYRCVMEDGLAREAMRLPCCARVMCHDCFLAMAEAAMRRMTEADSLCDGGEGDAEAMAAPRCPGCGVVLIMDEVVPAQEERAAIEQLRRTRKRASSPHGGA